jgi:uncharacterized membrane protein YbaN (DUF454 family)
MKELAKGVLFMTGGVLCLVIGFAGIFLPIIPGVPLMLLGLHLLGVRMPFLTRMVDWVRQKAGIAGATKEK